PSSGEGQWHCTSFSGVRRSVQVSWTSRPKFPRITETRNLLGQKLGQTFLSAPPFSDFTSANRIAPDEPEASALRVRGHLSHRGNNVCVPLVLLVQPLQPAQGKPNPGLLRRGGGVSGVPTPPPLLLSVSQAILFPLVSVKEPAHAKT